MAVAVARAGQRVSGSSHGVAVRARMAEREAAHGDAATRERPRWVSRGLWCHPTPRVRSRPSAVSPAGWSAGSLYLCRVRRPLAVALAS
jgi:hypothetical protein